MGPLGIRNSAPSAFGRHGSAAQASQEPAPLGKGAPAVAPLPPPATPVAPAPPTICARANALVHDCREYKVVRMTVTSTGMERVCTDAAPPTPPPPRPLTAAGQPEAHCLQTRYVTGGSGSSCQNKPCCPCQNMLSINRACPEQVPPRAPRALALLSTCPRQPQANLAAHRLAHPAAHGPVKKLCERAERTSLSAAQRAQAWLPETAPRAGGALLHCSRHPARPGQLGWAWEGGRGSTPTLAQRPKALGAHHLSPATACTAAGPASLPPSAIWPTAPPALVAGPVSARGRFAQEQAL